MADNPAAGCFTARPSPSCSAPTFQLRLIERFPIQTGSIKERPIPCQSAERIHGKENSRVFSSSGDQQEQPFVQVSAEYILSNK